MTTGWLPTDYSSPFWLEGPVGNNAFAWDRRGPSPRLRVPSLLTGTVDDVAPGTDVAFADEDEHGTLHACTGLAHLVRTRWHGVPTVIVDNHNHAFYFWVEALAAGLLRPGATLIHVDQHRDTRDPGHPFDATWSLAQAFAYTNAVLNVGNYIVPARQAGLVGDAVVVTGRAGLDDRRSAGRSNTILNIDLDFFAPEMAYIDFDLARRFIDAHLPTAGLVTIATSPFFIEQDRAMAVLRRLTGT